MSLVKYAMREFKICGWVDEDGKWKDDMQKIICENVLNMIKVFSDGDHSGSTASYALALFEKLAVFKPLKPLTGKEDEWNLVGDEQWQNVRCGSVFKDKNGKAYNIDGKVFENKNGSRYTSGDSIVYIDFPYTPKTEIVCVEEQEKENEI
jgi:hypothetical protein